MFGRHLHGIEHAKDFVKISSGRHGVGQNQFDLLVRTDDIHGANCGIGHRRASFAGTRFISREHIVGLGNGKISVTNHRKIHPVALGFLDVIIPFCVVFDRVDAQAHDFGIALFEFRHQSGNGAEFSGANRCEVFWV